MRIEEGCRIAQRNAAELLRKAHVGSTEATYAERLQGLYGIYHIQECDDDIMCRNGREILEGITWIVMDPNHEAAEALRIEIDSWTRNVFQAGSENAD